MRLASDWVTLMQAMYHCLYRKKDWDGHMRLMENLRWYRKRRD